MEKLVSVIIPVYNAAITIKNTIKSVLEQSYMNIEVIIIDDCSMDNSYEIIKKLSLVDERIVIYKNDINIGVAKTRNYGISVAKGEYIAFLDSDDSWIKNKLQYQIDILNKCNADLCYTGYHIINRKNQSCMCVNISESISYSKLLKENIICCSSVVIKANLVKKYSFESDFFHEDFVLWLKLLKNGYKPVGVNEPTVIYARGGRSSDKVKAFKYRWEIYRKCEKLTFLQSVYYSVFYTFNGIRKHFFGHSSKNTYFDLWKHGCI